MMHDHVIVLTCLHNNAEAPPFRTDDCRHGHADIARQYKLTTSTAIRGSSHGNLPNLRFHIHHRPLLLHVMLVILLVCSRITSICPLIVQLVMAVLKTGHPLRVNAVHKIMQHAQTTLQIILHQLKD